MKINAAVWAFAVSVSLAVALLGLTALASGQWGLALAAAVVGAGWGAAHRLGWRWVSPLAFVVLVLLAVDGFWGNLPPEWLVPAVAAALSAWDLDGFAVRLARFEPRPEHARLVRRHLTQLALVNGAGLVLGEAALRLRITLEISLVVGLGLLAFILLQLAARLVSEVS